MIAVTNNRAEKNSNPRLKKPLTNLFCKIIDSMLQSGELVIRDGVLTLPGEAYILPLTEVERVTR